MSNSNLSEKDQKELKELRERRIGAGARNSIEGKHLSKPIIQAYERYVFAQFRIQSQSDLASENQAKLIEEERNQAIESLIPGSLNHLHLFFLDLSKKKKSISDFSSSELELYVKFEKQFHYSPEFREVEMRFMLFNQLEDVSSIEVGSKVSDQQAQKCQELIAYLMDYCVQKKDNYRWHQLPDYMRPENVVGAGNDSQSDSELASQPTKTEEFNYDSFFSRKQKLEKAQNHLKKIREDWDRLAPLNNQVYLQHQLMYGLEEELDWSMCPPIRVMDHCEKIYNLIPSSEILNYGLRLSQITNQSFLSAICEFFIQQVDIRKKEQKEKKQKEETEKKILKQLCQEKSYLFGGLTIHQQDFIKSYLQKKDFNMWKIPSFVEAYFQKIFSEELSTEYQEQLSQQEKLQNILKLYQFAKDNDLPKSLRQNLLHEILTITIKLDDYREDLFDEYLKYPIEYQPYFKDKKVQEYNNKGAQKQSRWNNCLRNVQKNFQEKVNSRGYRSIDSEKDVIPKYLRHICIKNEGSLAKYNEKFSVNYLQEIEKKVKVYLTDKGLIDFGGQIGVEEFARIQNEVILRLKETNAERFKVEESVVLKLELKNVPELIIRVYEFNTETYYKKNMVPFDTSISLQGMEPSFMKQKKFLNVKKNKILSEDFAFDELIGKVGTFIIEFQGNGKLARAVIKKGSLTLIHHSTIGGHQAFLIDADRKICTGEGTGVWIDKKFYPANAEKNGSIFIPYTKGSSDQAIKLIMIHNGFAQLGDFMRKAETYNLECFYHINSESFLVGQEASVMVRPMLTVNGRKTSLKFLKQSKIILKIRDFEDKETKQTFTDLQFKDDQEYILSFQVPPNSCQISLQLSSQVTNATNQKTDSFNLQEKVILISEHKDSVKNLNEQYLRKIGSDYFLYVLGRNGEAQLSSNKVKIRVKHKDYVNEAQQNMNLDKQGKVKLGPLKDVDSVQSCLINNNGGEERHEVWMISHEKEDKWTLPEEIHIIQGESVEVPINWNQEQDIKPHQASLLMSRDGYILNNMFKRIKLIDSAGKAYKLIRLDGLEVGDYELHLRLNANQHQQIRITVHRGTYWQGNFILKRNCLYESSVQKNMLRIETTQVESQSFKENVDGTTTHQTILKVQLNNFSKKSRIHVFATQFVPNFSQSLLSEIESFSINRITGTNFPFAVWRNLYESDHSMSDEIRYVYNRRSHEAVMGNNLDRPSLLMKRTFVRMTHTNQEDLSKGTTYAKRDLASEAQPHYQKEMFKGGREQAKRKKCSKGNSYHHEQVLPMETSTNKIKDYQNFLACAPLQLFNLKPNEEGQVTITLSDISNYQEIYFVACDEGSVVQRNISTNSILQNQENVQVIPMRDLSQNKQVSDLTKGLIQQRSSEILKQGDRIHIEDITSSKVIIIDELSLVVKVVEMVAPLLNHYPDDIDTNLQKMTTEVLLLWNSFEIAKKIEKFQQFVSHELNVFLFKKDRQFFDKYVVDHIANKLEKTFVDFYLLASSQASQYLSQKVIDGCKQKIINIFSLNQKIKNLNMFEIALGIEFLIKNLEADSQILRNVKSLAQLLIDVEETEMEQKNNQQQWIDKQVLVFDTILNVEDLEKGNINKKFQADDDFHSYGQPASPKNQIQRRQASPQRSMMLGKAMAPPMMQMSMAAPMMQNIQPMAQSFGQYRGQQNFYQAKECEEALFDDDCDEIYQEMEDIRSKVLNDMGFQELENTQEFMETHYYNNPSAGPFHQRFSTNLFVTDYLKFLLNNDKDEKFLSKNFTQMSLKWLPAALSWLDLPFIKSEEAHKFKSDKKRGIFITASSNAIVFKKEIKDGDCNIKSDLMIIHRYESLSQSTGQEVELDEFVVNHPYQCEVIMTNVSAKRKQVTLLYQIPNGALPLQKTKYIESRMLEIEPYTTRKLTIQFYFPGTGNYLHHASCVSENQSSNIVVAKSEIKSLEVGKKRVIKKVETFRDLMLTTHGEKEKKEKLIEIIQKQGTKIFLDQKFGFEIESVFNYCYNDLDFFLKIYEITLNHQLFFSDANNLLKKHIKTLVTDKKYQNKLPEILQWFQQALFLGLNDDQKEGPYGFLAKSINKNPLIVSDIESLLNIQYKHLDYSPIVNQRVFSVKESEQIQDQAAGMKSNQKDILNVQLKETYQELIRLLVLQDLQTQPGSSFGSAGAPIAINFKLKLQLTYYLQLQDRIDEAIAVFKSINVSKEDESNHELGFDLITYDYMRAYFDFYGVQDSQDVGRFSIAREIVKKYEDCKIKQFQNAFKKIKEQLDELDSVYASISSEKEFKTINPNEIDGEATEEQKRTMLAASRSKNPQIKEIDLDDKTGRLSIESENLNQVTVKYYLIDTEILFSRQPFVQDQAEKFSYVKPYLEIKTDLKNQSGKQLTVVPLPENLVGRNVVIEINSDEIQKFKTFFSSELQVRIDENFGELYVFHKKTMRPLPKVYVKVFCRKGDNSELFYRDGFTDIRGKFEYAQASGKSLNDIKKFAIFIAHDETSLIKEVDPPKQK